MMSRGMFITTAAAGGLGAAGALASHASHTGRAEYQDAVRQTWRHGERVLRDTTAALLELVRHATLAPSSHNSRSSPSRSAFLAGGPILSSGSAAVPRCPGPCVDPSPPCCCRHPSIRRVGRP